jgi:uncharacterized cupredoxin-like copper-binding protein
MNHVAVGVAGLFALFLGMGAMAAPGHNAGQSHSPVGQPGDPKRINRTISVEMNDEMRFVPDSISVKSGETIRFVVKNIGEMKHEMMFGTKKEIDEHAKVMQQFPDMEHDDGSSITLAPGKTGEIIWRFSRAGTFMFGCLMPGHVEAGMIGRVTVRR